MKALIQMTWQQDAYGIRWGEVRRLLGMWVCSSGERKLEGKVLECQHRGGN